MKFGVWIPTCRHLATVENIRHSAVRAEQLGYDSVWVSDHVVVPQANIVNFGETIFDPLVTLAVVAGATSRVRLGTTVLIVPGLAWAAVSAARGDWRQFGTGLALAAISVVGAFAGPAGSWAVAGVGLCALMLGHAAAVVWRQRG